MNFKAVKNTLSIISFSLIVIFCMAGLVSVFYLRTPPTGLTVLLLVSASLFLFRISDVVQINRLHRIQKSVFWFGLFVIVSSLNLIAQGTQGYDLEGTDGRSSYWASLEVLALGIVWFLCGASIQFLELTKSNTRATVLFLFVFFLVALSLNGGLVVSYAELSNAEDGPVSHLTTGDNVVILLLIGYGLATKRLKYLAAPLILMILFSLGGRNSLITLAFAILIFHLSRREIHNIFALVAPIIVATIGLGIVSGTNFAKDDLVARMLFSEGLASDASFRQRNDQILDAVNDLPTQAPIGNAALIVKRQGTFGGYSHNLLSAWQLFGIIPFAILLLIVFRTSIFVWLKLKEHNSPLDEFAAILLIYSVLCVFVSRAIGFPCFWLAMGYWITRSARYGTRSR